MPSSSRKDATPTKEASSGEQDAAPEETATLRQIAILVSALLGVCCLGGVLLAGIAMPFAATAGTSVNAVTSIFEETPSNLGFTEPSEQSVLLAADGTQDLVGRRPFHDGDGGRPDGLAVDSEGNVWCAMNRVGKVRLYSPEAEILGEWELPVHGVTAVTLGGPDLRDVFITTSRETADEPHAGAVFHMRTAVPGQPTRTFAG